MRIAALYDIHSNLSALDAVLEDVRLAGPDAVVVGGDVLPGPMPKQTLARLLALDIPPHFIYGNGEIAVLEVIAGKQLTHVPEAYWPVIRWTAQQISSEHQRFISAWPKTLRLQVSGLGEVLFCHATPRDENEIFTRLTPEERLAPVFEGIDVWRNRRRLAVART
jgi:hypothetical protein